MPVSVGELLAYLRLDSSGFDRGIRVAQTEMRTATGTADRMGAAVGVTSDRLTGAGRAAQVAASGSAKYRAAQLSLVAAQERYNTVLGTTGATAGKLAAAEAGVLRANERVAASARSAAAASEAQAAAMRAANASAAATPGVMARTATGFAGAARSAIGLGAAFGAFELARKAIDIGKDASKFQQSMLLIQTNANAGAAEVRDMSKAVLAMSGEVATKPLDLANALYHVEQNGLRGGKALEALRAGAQGAKIGLADVEDTTNTMTIAVASGITGMGNLQKAMGTMIAIAGTGDMRLKDLNEALSGGILAVAKGFGASLQDVAAVLATLGDNGIRGADAATALRQTMMGFAAPAAKGKKALADIGLSMTSLADDMQKHGLVFAMNDLEKHMVAAGITGGKVGAFITQAFGKKAGAGLAVLMGEIDRVNTKFAEGGKGAASFSAKWEATTHTTAFAFQKIGAEVEAAGIKIAQKLTPAVTIAANWIGTTLPRAFSVLRDIMTPFIHDVGAVLGPAWVALVAVLKVAVGVIGVIGGVAKAAASDLGRLATEALAVYAAFKTVGYGVVVFKAVQAAIVLARVRLLELAAAYRTLTTAELAFGVGSLTALKAAGGLAGATSAAALAARRAATAFSVFRFAALATVGANSDQIDTLKQTTAQYQYATHSTDLSAKAFIRWAATAKNETLPVRDVIKALGISADDLSKGISGSDAEFKKWTGTLKDNGNVLGVGTELLNKLHSAYKNTAGAVRGATVAQREAVSAGIAVAAADKQITSEEDRAAAAAKRLDDALKALSGQLSSSQALDQFRSSVLDMKNQLDKNTHSIDGNRLAAVKNRLAIDQAVQGALSYGSALKDQGKTQSQVNVGIQQQIRYMIRHAAQMGVNRGELVRYLGQLGLLPRQIDTRLTLQVGQARINLQEIANRLANLHDKTVTVNVVPGGRGIGVGGRASGGGLPEGVAAVGEAGPELAIKRGSNVQILSNSQSKAYLSATGMKAPGFASGTLNPHSFKTSLGRDASSESYAFQQLLAVGQKAGISSGLAKHLTAENRAIAAAINIRNGLADKLSRDNQRLADAQTKLADEAAAVKGAITGSFDVTTAGAGFDGQQPITGRNMVAEETQAATRARMFVAAIKKLKGKIGAGYLYQLAEKGPSALAEAQALLSLSKADLSAFNSAAASLNTSGTQLGSAIGGMRFGGEVTRDKAAVQADKARLAAENRLINTLGNRIVKQLENGIKHLSNPHLTIYLDGKKLATAVAQGSKKNGARS